MYWALRNWLANEAALHGLEVSFVDTEDSAALAGAISAGRTKLVWLETPSNPLWGVSDIAEAAWLAHAAGARVAVDSTCATPIFTRPIELGADVVMHSATKYLNGHSDVIAGALCFARDDELLGRAIKIRQSLGLILGPFEAFLLIRGLRTLDLRARAAAANAAELAERLANHWAVSEVLYPGLPTHKGHEVAKRQMRGGFGGMLSIRVGAGEAAAIAAAASVKLWKRATSLGGVESLIEHRASIEGPSSPCPPDLLRLSAGVEDVEDLWRDISQALEEAPSPASGRGPG
jgi:cystathionine gamma-synthase